MESKDLKQNLKTLKLYRELTNKLWKRWKIVFDKIIFNKDNFVVEYYPSISEDFAFDKALEIYNRVFSSNPSRQDIVFMQKKSISWGMKIYKNDDVVDLSFSKIEKFLRK